MQMSFHVVLKVLSELVVMQKGSIWREMKPPSSGFIQFTISLFWYGQHWGFGVHQQGMSDCSRLKQRARVQPCLLSYIQSPTSGMCRWMSPAGFPAALASRTSLHNHNWRTSSQDTDGSSQSSSPLSSRLLPVTRKLISILNLIECRISKDVSISKMCGGGKRSRQRARLKSASPLHLSSGCTSFTALSSKSRTNWTKVQSSLEFY